MPRPEFWKNKRVLITGHTGFKGSWLSLWLATMGAKVYGLALEPPTEPNFFSMANVGKVLSLDTRDDIRDESAVFRAFSESRPDIVFHMAAQSLVRESYKEPACTFFVNSLGTVNILEAIRGSDSVKTAVMVTTDKVYMNREIACYYCEQDPLAGNDPYSASKACAELIIGSYRSSFLAQQGKSISSARAGNVVGGGDWSCDRLVPDAIRAFIHGKTLFLRNPGAIRPWQHILDVLSGYLILAEAQWREPEKFACAFNFAPCKDSAVTVEWVAKTFAEMWGEDTKVEFLKPTEVLPEAGLLMLDAAKANAELGWHSRYSLTDTLQKTADWHKFCLTGGMMQEYSLNQLKSYINNGDNGSE